MDFVRSFHKNVVKTFANTKNNSGNNSDRDASSNSKSTRRATEPTGERANPFSEIRQRLKSVSFLKKRNKRQTQRQRKTNSHTPNSHTTSIDRELFQPELKGGVSYILVSSMIQTMHSWLPLRLNWLDWRRLYTSSEDGTSMLTFYNKIGDVGPTILIVKDEYGYVFGVFISQAWSGHSSSYSRSYSKYRNLSSFKFFGGSDTFVFQIYPNAKKYEWTKSNRFFVFCEKDGITIGGGDHPALRLHKNLSCGTSQHSDTYNNSPLSKNEDFKCVCVEVWGFDEYK